MVRSGLCPSPCVSHVSLRLLAGLISAALAIAAFPGNASAAEPGVERLAETVPPYFERNVGQFPDDVLFTARGIGGRVDLHADGLTFWPFNGGREVELVLLGGEAKTSDGMYPRGSTTSYLMVSANRVLTSRQFEQVLLHGVYPGIDMRLRFTQGALQFDFLLGPGADPAAIDMQIRGADRSRLDGTALLIETPEGTIRLQEPVAFQTSSPHAGLVPAAFQLVDGSRLTFEVGEFDPAAPLTIDPEVELLGWFRSEHDDWLLDVATDGSSGVTYAGGMSVLSPAGSSASLTEVVSGAGAVGSQAANCGFRGMAWLAALTDTSTSLLYVCDLNADGDYTSVRAVDVGDDGNVYAVGEVQNGLFLLVARLDGSGVLQPQAWANGALLVEATLGGENFDDQIVNARALATIPGVQAGGGVAYYIGGHYIAGPTVNGGILSGGAGCGGFSAGRRAWITKQPAFPALPFGSGDLGMCYGAIGADEFATIRNIAVGPGADAYVVATTETAATDFGNLGSARIGPAFGGGEEYVVARVGTIAGQLQPRWWRFLGGSDDELTESGDIAVDGDGRVHVVGRTRSGDIVPTNSSYLAGPFTPLQAAHGGQVDGFYAILDPSGLDLEYLTYGGGASGDTFNSIQIESDGTVWVAGSARANWGGPWDFSGFDDAASQVNGGDDAILVQFRPDGTLGWGSYLGGDGQEFPPVLSVMPSAGGTTAFVAGWTQGTSALDPWLPAGGGVPASHERDDYILRLHFPAPVTNAPPVAVAPADAAFTCAPTSGVSLDLDGSASYDPESDLLVFRWLDNGTEIATGEVASVTLAPGIHNLTLEVTDGINDAVTDEVVITVVADVESPIFTSVPDDVVATADGPAGAQVVLPAAEAIDECSGVLQVTPDNPLSVYPIGITEVTYTATDGVGNSSAPAVVTVTVLDPTQTGIGPQQLLAGDRTGDDWLGWSAATRDDMAMLGAYYANGREQFTGAVYAFERVGPVWLESQKLTASDGNETDWFGAGVGMTSNLAVVGAPGADDFGTNSGAAYVFERGSSGMWTEVAKLTAGDAAAESYFGAHVAIDGSTIVVAAVLDQATVGSSYVFERIGDGAWVETTKLTSNLGGNVASGDDPFQGIDISGDTVIVGAMIDGGPGAYLFDRVGSSWVSAGTLAPANGDGGFGSDVAIDGDVAVIGNWNHSSPSTGSQSGAVFVFERTGGGWREAAELKAHDASSGRALGTSVDVSGDTIVAGGGGDDRGPYTGSVYVFQKAGGTWRQVGKVLPEGVVSGDDWGWSVAIDGLRAVAGARFHDDAAGNALNAGAGWAFEIEEATVLGQARQLQALVEQLLAQLGIPGMGGRSDGEFRSLLKKVEAAVRAIERDNPSAARGNLGAFVNQVNALIRSRRLTESQGRPLIDKAELIIEQLGG